MARPQSSEIRTLEAYVVSLLHAPLSTYWYCPVPLPFLLPLCLSPLLSMILVQHWADLPVHMMVWGYHLLFLERCVVWLNKHKLGNQTDVTSNPSSLTSLLHDIEESDNFLRLNFLILKDYSTTFPSWDPHELGGSNKVTWGEHLARCLAPSRHLITGNHSYLLMSGRFLCLWRWVI